MKKILIVEDDTKMLDVLSRLLKLRGFEVITTKDGEEAFNVLKNDQSIDIALVDWDIPLIDGVELTSRIKKLKDRYVYIIMLTGRTGSVDECYALNEGVDDFVKKPFEITELQARIRAGGRVVDMMSEQRELANIDPLTQLANRRKIYSQVEAWSQQSDALAVCLIDVDDFKDINRIYGYERGDEVLEAVARVLRGFDSTDVIAGRWGGDEMILIFFHPIEKKVTSIIHELISNVRDKSQTLDIPVALSVGVSFGGEGEELPFDDLCKAALGTLRVAKKHKNTFCNS